MLDRFWARYAELLSRHAGKVLLLSLLSLIPATYYTVGIYSNLMSDLDALLPDKAPAVVDLRALDRRYGTNIQLAVVIEGDDPGANLQAAEALGNSLSTLDPQLIRRVDYNQSDLIGFVRKNQWLLVDRQDLGAMREWIEEKVRAAKLPMYVSLGEPARPPEKLIEKYQLAAKRLDQFKGGYFASADGKDVALIVWPRFKTSDYASIVKLKDEVAAEVARLDLTRFHPSIRVGYGSDVENVRNEHEALVSDIAIATALVLLAVALVIYLYYRRWWSVPVLGFTLTVGTLWTFGLAYFLVGHLNANTAFLGSIVYGNGINVGILLLARYLEERDRGRDAREALVLTLGHSWQATLVAALAAGASYGCLAVTQFRGFNEFGIIGATGMALCWLAAFLVLPAVLVLMERRSLIVPRPARPLLMERVGRLLGHTKLALGLSALLTAVSLVGAYRLARDPYEYDMRKLRAANPATQRWDPAVDRIFNRFLSPSILLGQQPQQIAQAYEDLTRAREAEGEKSPLGELQSLYTFLPRDQEARIQELARIRKMLSPRLVERLPPEQKKIAESLLSTAELEPIRFEDLPFGLRQDFTERDGRKGLALAVYPNFHTDIWDGRVVREFVDYLRKQPATQGLQLSGSMVVFADIISSIRADGLKATVLSFGAVLLVTLLLLRRLRHAAWVMLGLSLGVLWFAGLTGLFGLRLNLLNFIAFPITFGIGVDYAVNLYQRYVQCGDMQKAIRQVGGAVVLCSATTVIGYSSLLIADNRALVSFGQAAALGELACLAAALVFLPAFLVSLPPRQPELAPEEDPAEDPEVADPETVAGA